MPATARQELQMAAADSPGGDRVSRGIVLRILSPLEKLAANSTHLVADHSACFEFDGLRYELPRYLFEGPSGGGEQLRIGIFAGVHGDEPEGVHALVRLLALLEQQPQLVKGYQLYAYPVCNPTGLEDGTRHSRSGKDLNREFWRNSREPEVLLLQSELLARAFHGIMSLHTDDTSHGFYGYAQGATLTKHLVEPALHAAAEFLPRNENDQIDGFPAQRGIIRKSHEGVLSAPPKARPKPFEVILETPRAAPYYLKEAALVAAMQTILNQYRELISYAQDL